MKTRYYLIDTDYTNSTNWPKRMMTDAQLTKEYRNIKSYYKRRLDNGYTHRQAIESVANYYHLSIREAGHRVGTRIQHMDYVEV